MSEGVGLCGALQRSHACSRRLIIWAIKIALACNTGCVARCNARTVVRACSTCIQHLHLTQHMHAHTHAHARTHAHFTHAHTHKTWPVVGGVSGCAAPPSPPPAACPGASAVEVPGPVASDTEAPTAVTQDTWPMPGMHACQRRGVRYGERVSASLPTQRNRPPC